MLSLLLGLTVSVFLSCEEPTPTRTGPPSQFEGILETDAICTVIGGDTTDWRPRPRSEMNVVVESGVLPACPNPAVATTTLSFALADTDSVWILAYDRPGAAPVDTIVNSGGRRPGAYLLAWSNPGGPGIYRVRFFSARGLRAYGDVEFTE